MCKFHSAQLIFASLQASPECPYHFGVVPTEQQNVCMSGLKSARTKRLAVVGSQLAVKQSSSFFKICQCFMFVCLLIWPVNRMLSDYEKNIIMITRNVFEPKMSTDKQAYKQISNTK